MRKGYFYAIVGAVLFGTAGMFIKFSYVTGLDSVELLTIQYIIAVIIMFALLFIRNKRALILPFKIIARLAVLGILGNTFMTVFYYKAFQYLPVAMVTMLLYTYPLMVFGYAVMFERAKVNKRKAYAIVIALIGSFFTLNLLGNGYRYSSKGIMFGILSAAFYAFMNMYSEKYLESVNSLAINAYSTFFSLFSLFVYKPPYFLFHNHLSGVSILYIFILATLCEIIPLTLLYAAIKRIGALRVSIISNLEIPTAILISLVIMKERVSIYQIAGAGLIIYAVYVIKSDEVRL